ncbi:transmembrane protein 94 isoform X2 [Sitodiplosis mosellana]|uniref:transmembrane protein 94 isoform X2 n=1 Tax=Sitodiplosis mosellana TaxID=263140 RepID=UPI0024443D63|nr:transmembrane protein 94 isoform X2 [Sitodiplosis mosellana]
MVDEPDEKHLQSEKKPTDSTTITTNLGYTTKEALKVLCDEIETVVKSYETKFHNESLLTTAKSAFAKPYESPLSWFSIITTVVVVVCLALTKHYFTSICVLCILLATIVLDVYECYLRRTEIFRKVRLIINEVELAQKLCKDWTPENYPNVYSPMSPCVTLQLCYRDGGVVNLPWALLVKNDVIVIKSGQTAPGDCKEISGKRKFKTGETYGLAQPLEAPVRPTVRSPLPDMICILERTPFLDNLRKILDKSPKRPPTIYNEQRHLLITKYIQHWGVIACLLMTLLFAALHYNDKLYDDRFVQLKWMNLFIELPVCAILPVIPMMFPVMWISINLWGIARLETHLAQPQSTSKLDQQRSFQEDLDTPTLEFETAKLSFKEVLFNWLRLWRGYSMLLGRSSNVVQVLGSVTALCCIDKKGILSWPNPTAEKVLILRDAENDYSSEAESESSFDSHERSTKSDKNDRETAIFETKSSQSRTNKRTTESKASASKRDSGRIIDTHKHPGTVAEVLDLTHDQCSPFRIDFDDHSWKKHIDSLKPLGLAILVNTCCQKTQEHYSKFCAHVTAVATLDKDLVPVTNRRCLCELAKQIGFTDKATDLFNLEGQIASYMHLQPEVVRRDIRFARHLRIASKVKVPFPHSLSVVIRDIQSNSLQMLTQGTADIVLDCCDDFWDGQDLRPLGSQERKRAQDFYQRNALTSYCTAFAYRPLRHGVVGALGETAYMELPPESTYKTSAHHSCALSHERGGIFCTFDGAQSNCEPTATELKHSISSDSLLFSENNKEEDICDVDGCFEMQCHQVFIGMVTMQYQAQTDMVSLIERLERACIRFVHFSKENELRSRVFSEKMGLESGWNCHISLLSDDHSNAPSPQSQSHIFDPVISSAICNNEIMADEDGVDSEMNRLLPLTGLESSKNLSSSAPGAISDEVPQQKLSNVSFNSSFDSGASRPRVSKDSAMEDENCRSLSGFSDSTEQSAAINFDMSNRAKLPRGIENIRPHLENVDNVPLLVSLFTDCSAEATREMIMIMQNYGEIVICVGSSASCANVDIFLQADCSIAIEPLYPQVCQNIPAYTESNILNNRKTVSENDKSKKWFEYEPMRFHCTSTISPIYLSRQLNAIPCSVAVCRDDSFSILGMIELSRRFTNGLWNCIQFWVCCACMLALINTICACLALPPILTPFTLVYIMCVVVPLISTTLVYNEYDPEIMNRATGKKHSNFNSKVIAYVICSYGFKFIPTIVIMVLAYCMLMSHPAVEVLDVFDIEKENFYKNLDTSRCFIFYSIILHFVIISMSFVHRDYSIWTKNPFTNRAWLAVCVTIFIVQTIIFALNLLLNRKIVDQLENVWPIVLFLIGSLVIVFVIVEFCKWQELKANGRYQRRARLDFGTKLGMNSPF